MPANLKSRLQPYLAWRRRKSRLARFTLLLLELIATFALIGLILPAAREAMFSLSLLAALVLTPVLLVLLGRWISQRVLWKVRNRLIVTYLLMGLAPIVLFGTLTLITAYFLTGQYAASTALLPIQSATAEAAHQAESLAIFVLLHGDAPVNADGLKPGTAATAPSDVSLALLTPSGWKPIASTSAAPSPLAAAPVPRWLHPGFDGVVSFDGSLFIASERSATQGARTVTALATIPLDAETLDIMARPLGRVILSPGVSFGADQNWREDPNHPGILSVNTDADPDDGKDSVSVDTDNGAVSVHSAAPPAATPPLPTSAASSPTRSKHQPKPTAPAPPPPPPSPPHNDRVFHLVRGGTVPPATHLYDTRVPFSTPFTVVSWTTGDHLPALINVISRVTVLYAHLFATSLRLGLIVRVVLVSIAIFFGLIELLALWMAIHLGRTITCSVADLYTATAEIDRGNLEHRIAVKRRDQLGALSSSFNRMAASLKDLLAQQREKDRLLSELAIAQEVQRNLFPHSPVSLPGIELHAVCLPARTVSGDYFDFIFRHGSQLCITLGDISGKGISAALLMASLNSAVRAFSLESATPDALPSPARLIALLNRHLFQSTPPEKYATLFLAFYDTTTRRLTYTNAGHLPPVVMSPDGATRKLECGGSVVGLLDGLEYCEDTVELQPGDLLVAFSDGLTEPENDTGEFGEERLLATIAEHRLLPLPALANLTLSTLQHWIGNREQPDDMTIMLARQL